LEIRGSGCDLRKIDGICAQQFRLEHDGNDGCYWIIGMQSEKKRLGVARFWGANGLSVNVS